MTEDYDEACLSMLIANRGGLPEACDFCGQSFTAARWPVPEEGRAWACSECDARWAKEEASKHE